MCTETEKQIQDNTVLGVIETCQNELKTSNSKYMAYVCSRNGYGCCPLFTNWMYYVAQHGTSLDPDNPKEAHFIFPGMQAYSNDPTQPKSKKISTYVGDIMKVIATTSKLDFMAGKTTKAFRVGPTNIICMHEQGGFDIAQLAGGWGIDSKTSLGDYFRAESVYVSIAAKILGGYQFPRLKYPQPYICFVNIDDDILSSAIDRFLTVVLHLQQHHTNLRPGGSSYVYTKRLFATFLMRFREVWVYS